MALPMASSGDQPKCAGALSLRDEMFLAFGLRVYVDQILFGEILTCNQLKSGGGQILPHPPG